MHVEMVRTCKLYTERGLKYVLQNLAEVNSMSSAAESGYHV